MLRGKITPTKQAALSCAQKRVGWLSEIADDAHSSHASDSRTTRPINDSGRLLALQLCI